MLRGEKTTPLVSVSLRPALNPLLSLARRMTKRQQRALFCFCLCMQINRSDDGCRESVASRDEQTCNLFASLTLKFLEACYRKNEQNRILFY